MAQSRESADAGVWSDAENGSFGRFNRNRPKVASLKNTSFGGLRTRTIFRRCASQRSEWLRNLQIISGDSSFIRRIFSQLDIL
jgi:hypothetical protein